MIPASAVDDVRSFLAGLRRDCAELFAAKERPAPAPRPPTADESVFLARAAHWAPLLGVAYGRVRVKEQTSLWGSCTRDGNLNFNRRLLAAPPEVLDYIVIHELAHRLEMNHSPRFWAHVARLCPDHKERRRWLRREGERLLWRVKAPVDGAGPPYLTRNPAAKDSKA